MAIELARYERVHEVIVHQMGCRVWTTVSRSLQVSPVVQVDEGWRVGPCSVCRPTFGVVTRERHQVLSRSSEMIRRFNQPERKRRGEQGLDVPPGSVIRPEWEHQAACRSNDDRLSGWFAWVFAAETGMKWQTDVQKAICRSCPVRVDCLLSGVWGEEPWGVWGGATPLERKLLSTKWRREGRVVSRETPNAHIRVRRLVDLTESRAVS